MFEYDSRTKFNEDDVVVESTYRINGTDVEVSREGDHYKVRTAGGRKIGRIEDIYFHSNRLRERVEGFFETSDNQDSNDDQDSKSEEWFVDELD